MAQGNRRSAAGGGSSELVSRKAPKQRIRSILRSEDAFLYAESRSALSAEPNCGEKRKHSFKESGKTCELRRIP